MRHEVFITTHNGNTFTDCFCGWISEWTGVDESSRNAAKSAAVKHEAGAK